MRTPAAAIVPNITMVAPPSTGSGICCTRLATAGNRPSRASMAAMKRPTWRLATPVSWMTPLFWAKVDMGKVEKTAASMELAPSASTPPLIRAM
ncbi:hypothetical protein D3C79_772740 [compost metagenome]